jgi:2-desacetyl-2-hydroxyethyl bacteriochlorophyllide A dehydrogenase
MNVPTPLIMGHEFVGDIVKVGAKVEHISVGNRAVAEHVIGCGDCVYCLQGKKNLCIKPTVIGLHRAGALAEYICLPANLVYCLPDVISYDEGVLVEPLSIAVYAVRKAGINVGDSVAVVGQGPIGLFVDYVAKNAGAMVYGFDKHDNRLGYAKANEFINDGINITTENFMETFKKNLAPDGTNIVFEAVGSDSSAELALELAMASGQVVVLGVFEHDVTINMMNIVKKELHVHGSWTCIFSFDHTISLLQARHIKAETIITHRYPFADAIKAFQEASTDRGSRIKSVIEFE